MQTVYLHDKYGQQVGCVVVSVNGNVVEYNYSVCNKADKFDKSLARHIALGRLMESPIVAGKVNEFARGYDVLNVVMNDLSNSLTTPTRAKKAVRHWMNRSLSRFNKPAIITPEADNLHVLDTSTDMYRKAYDF